MDIQALRYVIVVDQYGSYSHAAKLLFVSQSSISRAIMSLEDELGFQIFIRHNQGVVTTDEGKNFISKIGPFVKELDQFSRKQFLNSTDRSATLMVTAQHSALNSIIFAKFAQSYCSEVDMSNLVFLEKPTEEVLTLVADGCFDVGILHYTSNQESRVMKKMQKLNLESHLLEVSRICVQIHKGHPLADRSQVNANELEPFPRITYAHEDVTEYNSCSETMLFNPEVQKKRILISDRGALRDMIDHTEGFYIGCDYSNSEVEEMMHRKFIPLEDTDYKIHTVWFKKKGLRQSQLSKNFVSLLEHIYDESKAGK